MIFLVFSDGFDVLMLKIEKESGKKFILIYFQVKSYFENHLSPQSQILTHFHLNCILLA